jgi:hypothetical protein
MALGIIELFTRIGEDHVRVQNLFDGDVDITVTKRGTRLSFYTDPANVTPGAVLRGDAMVALVVWMPREAVDRAIAEHRAPTPTAAHGAGDDDVILDSPNWRTPTAPGEER